MRRQREIRRAASEVLESRMMLSGDDAYEPNNSLGAAASLGSPEGALSQSDLVCNDADWFSFTMKTTGTASDYVKINFSNGSGDLDLALYNSLGRLKKYSQTTGDTESVSLSGLLAGTYYIQVYGYNGATNGNYTLSIHTPILKEDTYEPNNTKDAAWDLGMIQQLTQITSLSCLDNDYFKFTTKAAGKSSNYVSINFLNAGGDLDLELYNAAGQRIRNSNSSMDGESVSLDGLAAGTYTIRVLGYNGAVNTNYSLAINAPFSTLGTDAYETNDTFAGASDLGGVSGLFSDSDLTIGTSADVDWFKFTLTGNTTQSDYVRILFSNSSGDLDLELYDSSQNLLGKSNGSSNTENISLYGKPAGTYYVKVLGYNGAMNNYTLSVHGPEAELAADEYEPDDSFSTAADLRVVSGSSTRENLTIHSTTDLDYYQFTIDAMGTADNRVSILFDQTAGDLDLFLYDSNQNLIDSSETNNGSETISLALDAGTYYVMAKGYGGAMNTYSLTFNAPTAGPVPPDDYESSEPLRLSQDQTLTGLTIHDPAQNDNKDTRADEFVFTTSRQGSASDYVQIDFSNRDGNLKLTIENSSHVVLTTASVGDGSQRISLSGYAAGTYYIVVDAADPLVDPDNLGYSLTINAAFGSESSLPLWTILAYVDGDNNLEDAAIADVNEMEAALSNVNVQIGVMLDRIMGNDSSNGNWADTRRGIITHDSNTSTITSSLTSVGEKDMSSQSTLEAFIKWGVATLPAQNYMLVIWDHGAAFEGAAFDDSTGNDVGLSLTAINQALAASPEHISVLGFDACLMATAETLSAVTSTTDYLVASEQTEGNDGWNYTAFINSITSTTDPSTLASNLVNQAQNNSAISTLSALRTGDELDGAIADFVSSVLNNGTTSVYNELESARRASAAYDYDYMHDLGGFMSNVVGLASIAAIRNAAQDVLDALNGALVNNYSTSTEDGTGLTIYLPAKGEGIISSYATLAFTVKTGWRNFIKALQAGSSTATTSVGARDWAESNDYLAAGTNLNDLTAHGNIYSSLSINTTTDVDWFRFGIMTEGTATDQATITYDNALGNLDLYLYDSSGSLLLSSTAATSGTETVSLNGLSVGEYYLKIAGESKATNPSYTLVIDAPETNNGDWAEDNDTQQKATALTVGELNGGLTLKALDVDWYTFQADRLPSINPIVVTAFFNTGAGTLQMELVNTTGDIVANSTTSDSGATLTYSTFNDGDYWLKVTGEPAGTTLAYSLSAAHDFTDTLDSDSVAPTATLHVNNITKTGGKTLKFTVVYSDPSGVNSSSLATGDLQVKCGTRYSQIPRLISKIISGNSITAKYQIQAPGGTWTTNDRGTYTVTLLKKQVKDSAGNWNPLAVKLGTFKAFALTASKKSAAVVERVSGFSDIGITLDRESILAEDILRNRIDF